MSYTKRNVELALEELTKKRLKNQKDMEARLNEAYSKSSELKDIDKALSLTGLKVFDAALKGKDGLDKRMEALREENEALLKKRESILLSLGYEKDYTDLKYDCEKCQDTGYVMGKICSCLKASLTEKELSSSGVGELVKSQTFDSFSLDFYEGEDREQMVRIIEGLQEYVTEFETGSSKNLILVGATGLGKTHLSTAIAGALIEKGVSVAYETAQNIFTDFENERFYRYHTEPVTEKYFSSDLLIIDDLGTEAVTSFTVSCLYNIINSRINRGLPIILSTNLSAAEIRKIYNDRITSRIFGEFTIFSFKGKDIRQKKI